MQRQGKYILLMSLVILFIVGGCVALTPTPNTEPAAEAQDHNEESAGIEAAESEGVDPAFDIVHAQIKRDGAFLLFQQAVVGEAGAVIPDATGQLAGAGVESYVWPTSLDSSTVGFEPEQGILALAVTSHPDFDDTPLVDENGDGDNANDGRYWHSHWVVLVEDAECGPAGLKVRDIPEGETPNVPDSWPELPILIDSPNYEVELVDSQVSVRMSYQPFEGGKMFNYDGVAAGLRVNENVHSPLLCVFNVHDIASGDLSLPGVLQ